MFLSKVEKILVLLYRIQEEKRKTLLGDYSSYSIGENKIRQLKRKIENLGGDSEISINIQ